MKLGIFIAAALCTSSIARADLVTDAAAKSSAGDHLGAIALYERAYGEAADPVLLTKIGAEYRRAGKPLDAIRYFCSYIYTAPAGDHADEAAASARAIQAELGHQVMTDREACQIDVLQAPPPKLPGISKREIGGLTTLGLGIASFGFALYYSGQVGDANKQLAMHDPSLPFSPQQQDLATQAQTALTREKLFLVGGGVGLAVGAALWMWGHSARMHQERILLTPNVSRNSGGVTFSGKF